MSGGNLNTRVNRPLEDVTGPIIGQNLLQAFKDAIIKEKIFQAMFGVNGERIFITERPNINETILPALLLGWKSETYNSYDSYFQGLIDCWVVLPVRLEGDYNSLRRVGAILQRWMGGKQFNIFEEVPGLIEFGYGSEFNYEGLARFDGFSAPFIQISIPFKFDLQLLSIMLPGFDPLAPLDDSDLGWIEANFTKYVDSETGDVLIQEGILDETGQTN